jgi:hypothetical protein
MKTKKYMMTIICGLLVFGLCMSLAEAMNDNPHMENELECMRERALKKLGAITLFCLAWTKGRAFESENTERARKYDELIEKVRHALTVLLEVRSYVPDSSSSDIFHIEQINTVLMSPMKSKRYSSETFYKHLHAWNDDLFEILEDIQRWLGCNTSEFSAYKHDIEVWFSQNF